MKIIFFDLCSIPIYLLIIVTYYRRRMARYQAYRMFFMLTFMSLLCAILNTAMEFVVNPVPLTKLEVVLGTAMSFMIKWLRNGSMVVFLLFIFAISRTENRFRPMKVRLLIWLPNTVALILLIQNFFTGNVFSVTQEGGYSRGPLLIILYIITALYGIAGMLYCISCRKILDRGKRFSILMVYILNAIAVYIQFIRPNYMVEMFFSSLGLLILMLLVVRPEENIDSSVGYMSWQSFQTDLHTMVLSRSRFRVGVFNLPNAHEIRNYMGDQKYYEYIGLILDSMHNCMRSRHAHGLLYFEHPGYIYILQDGDEVDLEDVMKDCLAQAQDGLKRSGQRRIDLNPLCCTIRVPEDLKQESEIIKLCHRFPQLGVHGHRWYKAQDIVSSSDFEIENHIEDILMRATQDHTLQMYYQPIYDLHEKRYTTAEALARIMDRDYGTISPTIFIPAAERNGFILPLGLAVIDSVFRFLSEHDLSELGMSHIEINLSVEQCRQEDFADTVSLLQKKYGVSPKQVVFEITESVFGAFEEVVEGNIRQLVRMGYSFALDDYGTGYSNLKRLRTIPLSVIKIDKSLTDDMFSDEGRIVMSNTLRIMQELKKDLVVEGVETKESLDALSEMDCDYIQGFYFSKPLPEKEFLKFIKSGIIT